MEKSQPVHIMSIDVEEYFQVEAFAAQISRDTWSERPSRVVESTRRALDLFERHRTQATFFFVGWVARKYPQLVREAAARGHEVACHSYWHRTVYSLSPEEFRTDLREAKDVLEQASGQTVLGFRAPSWSITRESIWALDILVEEGFRYDSSIFPIVHDLYGIPNAQRRRYLHTCAGGLQLPEFPPATVRMLGTNFPAAGGGYLRIFPLWYNLWAFRKLEREFGEPVVVYFHPWELDPSQPRLAGKLKSRLRHYTGLNRMEGKLSRLLTEFRFQPFRNLLMTAAD